ncbi:integrator complex subunit 5-like protein [Chironomus tepperi]|uniref:integrator complex subunit 5-like protein n=1 Tax=Chironomus tepperi TaxID=113505 RepID=UPI00391F4F8F
MKSGKCCLLSSLVIIIGLGIGGYIFRDQIIHKYNEYRNPTDIIDTEDINDFYDSSEEIDTTTKIKITSTTTEKEMISIEDNYRDSDEKEDTSDQEVDIDSTDVETTTTPTTTVPTTLTRIRETSTRNIIEGSGSGYHASTKKPIYIPDDDDYVDESSGDSNLKNMH